MSHSSPRHPLSRRRLLALAAAATVAGTAFAGLRLPALAQQASAPAGASAAAPADDIAKPGPRGDIVVGKADAPITIVEYASMTCGHCASFHNTYLPTIKQKYIDTGQAKLVIREFPLDNLAAAVSMLARCAPAEKAPEVIGKFFETQDTWANVRGSPLPALFKVAEPLGFAKEAFDKCLKDEKLLADVVAVGERARKSFGVNATPTFFINGKKLEIRGGIVEAFDAALEPLLKK